MARPSEFLLESAKSLWENLGWGNRHLILPFLGLAAFSALLLAGFFFPAFATASAWIIGISLFSTAFIGISLLGDLKPSALFFGAIVGVAAAALAIALCSVALYVVPAITALLVVPNVLALTCGVLGKICKIPEAICDCLYSIFCCCRKTDSARLDSPKLGASSAASAASYNPHRTSSAQVHQGLAAASQQYQYGSRESDDFMNTLGQIVNSSGTYHDDVYGSGRSSTFHQGYGVAPSATVAAQAAGNSKRYQWQL